MDDADNVIQVATRVSPTEANMIRAAAGLQGLSMSEFMRPLIINRAVEVLGAAAKRITNGESPVEGVSTPR